MATRTFRRRPRLAPPALPDGEFALEAPPDVPRTAPANVLGTLLPGVMILGSVGFVAIGGFNTASLMTGGILLASTVGMMGGGMGNRRGARKAQMNADRNDYLAYLDQSRAQVAASRAQQRAALVWNHPAPSTLWSFSGGRRMWERRPDDDDFAQARVGVGVQRLAKRLQPPHTGPIEEVDPVGVLALRRFVRAHAVVPDLPLAVRVSSFPAVSVAGDPDARRALVRAIVCQLATFHGPDHLAVAASIDPSLRAEWDWLKWLPHNQHPTLSDSLGSVRMVATTPDDVADWFADELADRTRFTRSGTPAPGQRLVVLVRDGGAALDEIVVGGEGLTGVVLVDVSDDPGPLAARRGLRLVVEGGRVGAIGRDQLEWLGTADTLTVGEADAIARRLAPFRLGEKRATDDDPLAGSTELVDMLGVGDPADVVAERVWRPRSLHDRLRIPIGVGEQGEAVELDIKEAAQGGMGPHGLVIGATGSGKSELLRTLVLGLAITHSPTALNLILVDFKGGATFLGLQDLPHTAAVITNLQDDLSMVDRMYDALSGEMNRRQELLKSAGNFANVKDYERAREQGAPLDPLPSLLIVCDEFTEMLSQKPDFAELFVAIGRLGRSLSMHLLLASQRLEEGKLRGLDSHLSYRIGLKTFSAAESRTVLGVGDAYELPPIPGSGYLKFDTTSMVRFKAAYVSGPYTAAREPDGSPRGSAGGGPTSFTSSPVQLAPSGPDQLPPPDDEASRAPAPPERDAPAVVDVVVDRLRGQGRPAHEVWLPPLHDPPTFDSLLPPLAEVPGRGLTSPDWPGLGNLRIPVGLVDRPFEQRRDPLLLDLSGAAGHVAVVGGPQSGKSTALRDIVTALALTHTPDEVQIYGVDLGGGSLTAAEDLPHVGGIASRGNPDRIRRLVAEVATVLAEREEYFRTAGVESMADYRRQRAQGRSAPGDAGRFGDVFLVVDGWTNLRSEFEDLESRVTAIAGQGLSYGVHVVISATRWLDVRASIKDLISSRLELRLGDPADTETGKRAVAALVPAIPGRGITTEPRHFLTALPRIDGSNDATTVAQGFADLAREVSAAWDGATAPPVRMLPEDLPYDSLRVATGPHQVAIGINEDALAPVVVDFDADPHLLYFADAESGKTNLLKVLAKGLMDNNPASDVRILLVDYRRTMLDFVPKEYLAGYAASEDALEAFLADVRPILQDRRPGPDVTPAQLRDRSWWQGPELFVFVDDYDLVSSSSSNPMSGLLDFVGQARDVGLHLVLCRSTGGAGQASYEAVIRRLRESGAPGLVGSGSRDEGALLGDVRPSRMPAGRATLVGRRVGEQLVQLARI